jgi:hypothetical protein
VRIRLEDDTGSTLRPTTPAARSRSLDGMKKRLYFFLFVLALLVLAVPGFAARAVRAAF